MLPRVVMECKAVADPELRFAQSGIAVCTIRTVSNRQKKNEAGEWVDDKVCWLNVTCFKQYAEHVAESVTKGDLLLVSGQLQTEEWEDRDTGAKRSAVSVVADCVAVDLRFRTVPHSQRTQRTSQPEQNDPWAAPAGGSDSSEPPF